MTVQLLMIGNEKLPILIIDDLVVEPINLVDTACLKEHGASGFISQKTDYYPGVRKNSPNEYKQQIQALFSLLKHSFEFEQAKSLSVVLSAYSISITPPEKLKPIQMLPHFDTPSENQLAMVHYLCDEIQGGTSFYRHNSTGFERITTERATLYRTQLKQQALAEKLHEQPQYINGDTKLFKQVFSVEAKMNRAVIYPSNLLHSGNIRPKNGLLSDPKKGRLTISSFLMFQ